MTSLTTRARSLNGATSRCALAAALSAISLALEHHRLASAVSQQLLSENVWSHADGCALDLLACGRVARHNPVDYIATPDERLRFVLQNLMVSWHAHMAHHAL